MQKYNKKLKPTKTETEKCVIFNFLLLIWQSLYCEGPKT